MNSSPGTVSSKSLASAAMRRLLIAWLPILSVGFLIFWLSGGMPPTVWQLLIQMLSRWSVLQASLSGGIFLPFVIVLIQSIMILAAWILLVFTIWREISVINTLRAQQRVVRMQEALLIAQAPPPPPAVAASANYGVQVMSDELDIDLSQEDVPVFAKNTGIKIISGKNSEQDDLFDESQAVFELFPVPDEPEADITTSRLSDTENEETIFVYGNPFEGELPEVFEYDKDLKLGVQGMQDELKDYKKVKEEKDIEKKKQNTEELKQNIIEDEQ